MLDNLEHSKNIESCQWACQINPACNYFTFSKDKNVCILHRMDVRHRVCDIIHGPPVPSLQSCLNDNAIPWASSSGDNLEHITTNFIFFEISILHQRPNIITKYFCLNNNFRAKGIRAFSFNTDDW